MSIIIRKANYDDLPAIHDLVRDLAIYEKAEPEFTATIEDYQNDFKANIFESLVAEKEGQVIGMMLYYMTYSTWKGRMLYLEDFVIKEDFRRFGAGQLLWESFIKVAKEKGCRLAKWQVLDWNEPAIKFYEKNHAIIEKEWLNGKLFFN
ncbi:MAG: GNAT family N-acetyltransferase [Bacteroidetes bacterium]|jgi:GNAT superfamily N-acetyltransferase|nr:GNAT family N-acetyltransferase [Bacteroidota bacterium]MDF1865813.1 GNAT family N-acetyltransferase [Saprospiraceae bacterium]